MQRLIVVYPTVKAKVARHLVAIFVKYFELFETEFALYHCHIWNVAENSESEIKRGVFGWRGPAPKKINE